MPALMKRENSIHGVHSEITMESVGPYRDSSIILYTDMGFYIQEWDFRRIFGQWCGGQQNFVHLLFF